MRPLLVSLLVASALVLTGCATAPQPVPSSPAAEPTTLDAPAAVDVPGSVHGVADVVEEAPRGQRLALVVSAKAGAEEQDAVTAVETWAAERGDVLSIHDGVGADAVDAALAEEPDVIVGIGPAVVGAIDRASASHLDASFLVLGAQLAEPTDNVVAVVWPGADGRAVFADEELPFTGAADHASLAVAAGLGAFPSGLSGHVIALG